MCYLRAAGNTSGVKRLKGNKNRTGIAGVETGSKKLKVLPKCHYFKTSLELTEKLAKQNALENVQTSVQLVAQMYSFLYELL